MFVKLLRYFVMCLGIVVVPAFSGCGDGDASVTEDVRQVDSPIQTLSQNQASAYDGHAAESIAIRDQVLVMARLGQTLEAETLMKQHVDAVSAKYGMNGRPHAWTLYDLAVVNGIAVQMDKAVAALRLAAQIKVEDDREALRDRLTFLMNLGEYLESLGELEEAVQVHRDSLLGCDEFYGTNHAGYAFGLEPLASVLHQLDKNIEALELIDEAIAIFAADGHPRITTATALQDQILAKLNRHDEMYAGVETLPDELLPDLVDSILASISLEDVGTERRMLESILETARHRLGEGHEKTSNVIAILANLEGVAGNPNRRITLLRDIVTIADGQADAHLAIEALNGIAMALCDVGDTVGALDTYQDARQRAKKAQEPMFQWDVARNCALYLAELKRFDASQQEFERVVLCQSGQRRALSCAHTGSLRRFSSASRRAFPSFSNVDSSHAHSRSRQP